jgi:hypothetical protein
MVDRHQTRLFYAGFLFSSEIQNPAWNFLDLWMEYITNQGLALLLMKARNPNFWVQHFLMYWHYQSTTKLARSHIRNQVQKSTIWTSGILIRI